MSEKQKPTSDPFPHLARRPMFVAVDLATLGADNTAVVERTDHGIRILEGAEKANVIERLQKQQDAVVAKAKRGPPKGEGGRPKKPDSAVSARTLYRRKTEGK